MAFDPYILTDIQLNLALTDAKGLKFKNLNFHRLDPVTANIGNRIKQIEGTMNLHPFWAEFRQTPSIIARQLQCDRF